MNALVRPVRRLTGRISVPGDKSVSHRAGLLGAVATGVTEIVGFLEGEDCLGTLRAIGALGAEVTRKGPGHYLVQGVGLTGLAEPGDVIDCGNSGTTARLLLGILAGQPFVTFMTGDESLRRRPMARVVEPLSRMGARVIGRKGGSTPPLGVTGARPLRPIHHVSPVASAQVKPPCSWRSLGRGAGRRDRAGAEPRPLQRMLRAFGGEVETRGTTVTVAPGRRWSVASAASPVTSRRRPSSWSPACWHRKGTFT